MIEILKAVFLGLVQGITEWLPVSSTGHMILVDSFLKMNVSSECRQLFLVVVQLGSILAVIVLYFKKLWPSARKTRVLWLKIIVASVPAGIAGLLLEGFIEDRLYNVGVICAALIAYGVLFIVIERVKKAKGDVCRINSLDEIGYADALKIGCFQALALIPGTSRSGSTILGGMICSVERPVAAEFSFFMAIPIMAASSGLKLVKSGFGFNALEVWVLVSGTVMAFLVSLVVIKALIRFVRSHSFELFGWYRIVLGVAVIASSLAAAR